MFAFLSRRLLSTIPVLLIVSVLVFLLLRLTPGDPAAILAGDQATTEQIAQIRENLGLNRSIPEQYLIWAGHLLQGDLGQSFYYKTDVVALIGQRIEPTLSLALITIVVAVVVSVPLGVLAAWRHGGAAEGGAGPLALELKDLVGWARAQADARLSRPGPTTESSPPPA